ncbi:MAG TPA: hypothetical protein PLU43_05205 [Lachnospiraceae bacterium]|nr:hypothetical protein [Lachnospiraceae bacterium]
MTETRSWKYKSCLIMAFIIIFLLIMGTCRTETPADVQTKTYTYDLCSSRSSVGVTDQTSTVYLDLSGVGKISVELSYYYGKCGNCNASSGYTDASVTIAGVTTARAGGSTYMEISGLEEYDLGVTPITLWCRAAINNECPVCGRCSTEIVTIKSITTYVYPPAITKNPSDCQALTDGTARFSAAGTRISDYSWQKKTGEEFITLIDTVLENGTVYSGTNTNQLEISGIRLSEDQSVYRCMMTADTGAVLTSNTACMTVTDVTVPTLQITMEPKTWTNGPVVLTAEATDIDSGFSDMPYSWDAGLTYENAGEHQVSENGIYYVTAVDAAGNTNTASAEVTIIDRTLPTVSVSANMIEQTTAPVTIKITAEDKESGLKEQPYFYNGEWNAADAFEVTCNGNYEIKAADNAGNMAELIYEVNNIKCEEDDAGNDGNEDGSGESGDSGSSQDTGGSQEDGTSAVVPDSKIITPPVLLPAELSALTDRDEQKQDSDTIEEIEEEKQEMTVENEKKNEQKESCETQIEVSASQDPESGDENDVIPKQKNGIFWRVFVGCLCMILALLLLFLLFFGVLIEKQDPGSGKWKPCGVTVVYINKMRWCLHIGKRFDGQEVLRLRFGIVFAALFEGWKLLVYTKGKESGEIREEICQNLKIFRKQIRRQM